MQPWWVKLSKFNFALWFQDSELQDLKETIDILKTKNTEAQSLMQGALNPPDTTPKGFHNQSSEWSRCFNGQYYFVFTLNHFMHLISVSQSCRWTGRTRLRASPVWTASPVTRAPAAWRNRRPRRRRRRAGWGKGNTSPDWSFMGYVV